VWSEWPAASRAAAMRSAIGRWRATSGLTMERVVRSRGGMEDAGMRSVIGRLFSKKCLCQVVEIDLTVAALTEATRARLSVGPVGNVSPWYRCGISGKLYANIKNSKNIREIESRASEPPSRCTGHTKRLPLRDSLLQISVGYAESLSGCMGCLARRIATHHLYVNHARNVAEAQAHTIRRLTYHNLHI
jgi:hypothetical protein